MVTCYFAYRTYRCRVETLTRVQPNPSPFSDAYSWSTIFYREQRLRSQIPPAQDLSFPWELYWGIGQTHRTQPTEVRRTCIPCRIYVSMLCGILWKPETLVLPGATVMRVCMGWRKSACVLNRWTHWVKQTHTGESDTHSSELWALLAEPLIFTFFSVQEPSTSFPSLSGNWLCLLT